ncbi:hypothetical protein GBF38_012858 [Nibea albiflora]|uniref:Uncharacterized protein n=1 Tax=Nibea albiflora TaxID=240163 RepID=A0ACB7EYN4_NIBAL|nr:hypothetical protein GBF38_012858 [Nibea albiflora]
MARFSVNNSNITLENAFSEDEPRDERLAQVEIALLSIIFIIAGSLKLRSLVAAVEAEEAALQDARLRFPPVRCRSGGHILPSLSPAHVGHH